MHISLTPELESRVKARVDSGLYSSASEVIREALRFVDSHEEWINQIKLAKLREQLQLGVDQLDSGKGVTIKSYMMAIIGAEYILNMLPKGTHEHDKFIKPSEMEQWSRAANIKIDDLTGMHYNPLTMVYSLGSNLDVNYYAHAKPASNNA